MSICKPCAVAADYVEPGHPEVHMDHPVECGCTCQHKLPGSWYGEPVSLDDTLWVPNSEMEFE